MVSQKNNENKKIPGLYVHVPFCRSKCDYCDFFSVTPDKPGTAKGGLFKRYLDYVLKELEQRSRLHGIDIFDTVYFGGGTPSLLNPEILASFIDKLESNRMLARDTEISIEINPCDASAANLKGLKAAGINRFILGVQTLNAKAFSFIGRSGALVDAGLLDRYFSIAGVSKGVDIIAGIPGHAPEDFIAELHELIKYNPEHVSVYILTLEKGTPLYSRVIKDEAFHEAQLESYLAACDELKNASYGHYEISNFALNNNISRHNMKYWTWMPYLGLGPGAHSFVNGERYFNRADLNGYLSNEGIIFQKEERSANQAAAEYILTCLRSISGFHLKEMEMECGIDLINGSFYRALEEQKEYGNLYQNEDCISLTEKGIAVSDRVIYALSESFL